MPTALKFYCYQYLDTLGQPYYIGSGSGRRSQQKARRDSVPVPDRDHIVKTYFASIQDAQNEEIRLIRLYGRLDINTGILLNRSDGGPGCSNPSEACRAIRRGVGSTWGPKTVWIMRSAGPLHVRWHVNRGIKKSGCSFCGAQ